MHHIDPANADRILGPIEQFAKNEGLQPYHAIERTLGPTDYAHELLAYATEKEQHAQAWKSRYNAYPLKWAEYSTGFCAWILRAVWVGDLHLTDLSDS